MNVCICFVIRIVCEADIVNGTCLLTNGVGVRCTLITMVTLCCTTSVTASN